IRPQTQLPSLTGQTLVDGITESGVILDGSGLAQNGIVLAGGSDHSVGKGLTIRNFAGAPGIVQSDNHPIQQDILGASGLGNQVGVLVNGGSNLTVGGAGVGNTIGFNSQQGVLIISGTSDTISQNLFQGANGPNNPVQANDIVLVPGANNNQ